MHYQERCSTLYPSMDHLNHTKSYLRGGRATKDIDGCGLKKFYQVLPTRWTDDQGYRWVPGLKIFYQVLPTRWTDDQGYRRVPSLKKFYQVLPIGWTDDQGY